MTKSRLPDWRDRLTRRFRNHYFDDRFKAFYDETPSENYFWGGAHVVMPGPRPYPNRPQGLWMRVGASLLSVRNAIERLNASLFDSERESTFFYGLAAVIAVLVIATFAAQVHIAELRSATSR